MEFATKLVVLLGGIVGLVAGVLGLVKSSTGKAAGTSSSPLHPAISALLGLLAIAAFMLFPPAIMKAMAYLMSKTGAPAQMRPTVPRPAHAARLRVLDSVFASPDSAPDADMLRLRLAAIAAPGIEAEALIEDAARLAVRSGKYDAALRAAEMDNGPAGDALRKEIAIAAFQHRQFRTATRAVSEIDFDATRAAVARLLMDSVPTSVKTALQK